MATREEWNRMWSNQAPIDGKEGPIFYEFRKLIDLIEKWPLNQGLAGDLVPDDADAVFIIFLQQITALDPRMPH